MYVYKTLIPFYLLFQILSTNKTDNYIELEVRGFPPFFPHGFLTSLQDTNVTRRYMFALALKDIVSKYLIHNNVS